MSGEDMADLGWFFFLPCPVMKKQKPKLTMAAHSLTRVVVASDNKKETTF